MFTKVGLTCSFSLMSTEHNIQGELEGSVIQCVVCHPTIVSSQRSGKHQKMEILK